MGYNLAKCGRNSKTYSAKFAKSPLPPPTKSITDFFSLCNIYRMRVGVGEKTWGVWQTLHRVGSTLLLNFHALHIFVWSFFPLGQKTQRRPFFPRVGWKKNVEGCHYFLPLSLILSLLNRVKSVCLPSAAAKRGLTLEKRPSSKAKGFFFEWAAGVTMGFSRPVKCGGGGEGFYADFLCKLEKGLLCCARLLFFALS